MLFNSADVTKKGGGKESSNLRRKLSTGEVDAANRRSSVLWATGLQASFYSGCTSSATRRGSTATAWRSWFLLSSSGWSERSKVNSLELEPSEECSERITWLGCKVSVKKFAAFEVKKCKK